MTRGYLKDSFSLKFITVTSSNSMAWKISKANTVSNIAVAVWMLKLFALSAYRWIYQKFFFKEGKSHISFSFVRKKPISMLPPCTKSITNLELRTNSQWNVLDNAFTLPPFKYLLKILFKHIIEWLQELQKLLNLLTQKLSKSF